MKNITVSNFLQSNYEDYYTGQESEWRRLGAIDKADNIITLCKPLKCDSILEIGAGDGSLLKRLSELIFGRQFYALEISSSGADAIKKKEINNLIDCRLFDGYYVPYEDGKFDLAILSHVIEHVEYPRQLIYEALRVAKFVFIEVPLEDTVRLSKDFVFNKTGHINFYSEKTIRRLIQSCQSNILGQKITNPSKATYIYQSGSRGLFHYHIKNFMLHFFPKIATNLFCYHVALVCEKRKNE